MTAKCAALTIAHAEPDFVSMWYEYYSQHFRDCDMYMIVNGDSGDGGYPPVNLEYIEFTEHITQAVSSSFQELLKSYEYALYSDVDMCVVADPTLYPGGLSEFIDGYDKMFAQCSGYEIIGDHEPLDIDSRPWLQQRKFWFRDWMWQCKVCLAKGLPGWGGGFHSSQWNPHPGTREIGPRERQDLRLIHLGYICPDLIKNRMESRRGSHVISEPHKLIESRMAHLDHRFKAELIPEKWRAAL